MVYLQSWHQVAPVNSHVKSYNYPLSVVFTSTAAECRLGAWYLNLWASCMG